MTKDEIKQALERNKKYWNRREVTRRNKIINTSIAVSERELKKMYRDIAKDVIAQMENALLKMKEGKSVSHIFSYRDYYETLQEIERKLKDLGDREYKIINKGMTDTYKDIQKEVSKTSSIPFRSSKMNSQRINDVINATWCGDGKNWSQRIWEHQAELGAKLSKGLLDMMEAGITPQNLQKDLMKTFNASFGQTARIIRTEYVHVANESTINRYKDAGIQKYRFVCSPGACEICQESADKIFSVEDTEFLPPLHPNCRCTTLAVFDDDKLNQIKEENQ